MEFGLAQEPVILGRATISSIALNAGANINSARKR
jgi:hypothetical protein